MDLWKSVREGFYDRFLILSIKNKKSLTDGSIASMKMRPKVSIDTISINQLIHRQLCPSMLLNLYSNFSQAQNRPRFSCDDGSAIVSGLHFVFCTSRQWLGWLSMKANLFVFFSESNGRSCSGTSNKKPLYFTLLIHLTFKIGVEAQCFIPTH
jgi:hypothetical protein